MERSERDSAASRHGRTALFLVGVLALGAAGYGVWNTWGKQRPVVHPEIAGAPAHGKSRFFQHEHFGYWWGEVPEVVRTSATPTGDYSNILPIDYVGAAECRHCHAEQYQAWSQHPHRWMNAAAVPANVLGDFAHETPIRYLGGDARCWREGDQFFMSVQRGSLLREFRITRTIGRRFFQYYIGVQTRGPEPIGDLRYSVDQVLPLGYWFRKRAWVPTVHIREDRADDFDDPKLNPYEDFYFAAYDRNCATCHTTQPMGDWLVRNPSTTGHYTPHRFSLDLTGYLRQERPDAYSGPPEQVPDGEVQQRILGLAENRPPARILRLGIECEACHNGCKHHVADVDQTVPHFFPTSPLIQVRLPREEPHGRSHANVNWICARCHNGGRPQFPGGMSTWNSVEYTDAMYGSCYSQLRCIDCHDPHRATGPAWAHSADHDDGLCLKCHDRYHDASIREMHTRHAAGSEGDRCMNCHMPRINEGLDTVVRTHTIFSPTKRVSIEGNGPNACNLCHLDKSIDWTLNYLSSWYGRRYDAAEIDRNYASRRAPLGHVWLNHPFQATRLVAAAAYGRQRSRPSLPHVLSILDDKYLLNRQFGQMAVEEICGQSLEQWGYRFTLTPEERSRVLPRLKLELGVE